MNYGQALSLGNTKLKSKMEPTEALLTENAGTPVFKKQTHETSTTCKGVLPITEQDRVNQQYRMLKSYKVLMFNGPMGCSLKVMCSRRHEKEKKPLPLPLLPRPRPPRPLPRPVGKDPKLPRIKL
jgi:hypothetical protein